MRLCIPSASSKIAAAAAVVLREGSPSGPLIARVPLAASLATAHCGYLIGSYWLPGVMNDDPAAMHQTTVGIEPTTALVGKRRDVYLSIEGGGHVAIDWFRFE
jgi:hypothetical protein